MPRSLVLLDFRRHDVIAELRLPMDRLEIGFGAPLGIDPQAALSRYRNDLTAYIARHVAAVSPDGRAWTISVRNLRAAPWGQPGDSAALTPEMAIPRDELIATVVLSPPPGANPRRFTLRYDVIQHQLVTHQAVVSIRSDWKTSGDQRLPETLGTVGYAATELVIDRPAGSVWTGATPGGVWLIVPLALGALASTIAWLLRRVRRGPTVWKTSSPSAS
jgi:hypothetical protein